MTEIRARLSSRLIDANLGGLIPAMRHGKIEAALIRHEQRGPRAWRRRHTSDSGESVTSLILNDIEVSFAARDVQAVPRGVGS